MDPGSNKTVQTQTTQETPAPVYKGSTVVPYDNITKNANDYSVSNALNMAPVMSNSFYNTWEMANGSGFNAPQQGAMGKLQGLMDGGALNSYASGAYLDGSNNPYFSDVLRQSQDSAREAVNLSTAGMGRTGSGTHQGVLAKEVGDLTSRMLSGQYNTEVGNMFNANSALQGMSGDMFNAGQQGIANRVGATQMLPGQYAAAMMPFDTMRQVGAMNEDLATRQMNDQLRIWEGSNPGASRTTTIQQPKTSPFMAGLGGAATGYGVGGPIGAAIGGGAGLLSGLF